MRGSSGLPQLPGIAYGSRHFVNRALGRPAMGWKGSGLFPPRFSMRIARLMEPTRDWSLRRGIFLHFLVIAYCESAKYSGASECDE